MNLYIALQNSEFVDKSSRILEALEIRGPKNYLDLELTMNSMKNLPSLKILNFTTEICSGLKIADDPEMVLNECVQGSIALLSHFTSSVVQFLDLYFFLYSADDLGFLYRTSVQAHP